MNQVPLVCAGKSQEVEAMDPTLLHVPHVVLRKYCRDYVYHFEISLGGLVSKMISFSLQLAVFLFCLVRLM